MVPARGDLDGSHRGTIYFLTGAVVMELWEIEALCATLIAYAFLIYWTF